MSRSFLVVAVAVLLFGASSLVACEQCVPKGSKDPNGGGPYNSAICWTIDSGDKAYCWGGNTTCSGQDPENSCPIGGGGQCVELSGGGTVCVYNPDPILADPADPAGLCLTADLNGRCVGRQRQIASLLN